MKSFRLALFQGVENILVFFNVDIIKLLLPVSDYQLVLKKNIGHTGAVFLQPCIDEHESLLQKERLHNTLAHLDESKSNNSKRKI